MEVVLKMSNIKVFTSDSKQQWAKSSIKVVENDAVSNLILGNSIGRKFEGFGSSANELVMDALMQCSEEERSKVFDEFFLSGSSLNFEICRLPIGASDFALSWYSHNESENDFEMKNFSIERDKKLLIPYLKEALKRNPNLIISACPWSPPTWLKNPPVYNFGKIVWDEKYLKAYALYLTKFVKAYQNEGIKIHQLHVQNEVVADQKFPSCKWTGKELRDFIKIYLGPAFEENDIETEIWLGTINAPEANTELIEEKTEAYELYAGLVLKDKDAYKYIKGVGYQWAGKNAVAQNIEAYPELRYYQTELECGNGQNTWLYAHYCFNLYRHYLNNGTNGFIYWNGALKSGGKSTWGWSQNSMLTVDNEGSIIYNPEYYLMKHFSNFVQKNAEVVTTSGALTAQAVAFKNPDSSVVVVVSNNYDTTDEIILKTEQNTYQIDVTPHSFTTIVLPAK